MIGSFYNYKARLEIKFPSKGIIYVRNNNNNINNIIPKNSGVAVVRFGAFHGHLVVALGVGIVCILYAFPPQIIT